LTLRPLLFALHVALLVPGLTRAGTVVDRVVAVVNQDIVLWSELEALTGPVLSQVTGVTEEERAAQEKELRSRLLDRLVDQKIVEQAMERADVTVEAKEIQQAISDVARQNHLSLAQLEAELAKQGMGMEAYREEMRKQIRQYKFMNLEIRSRVHVDEEGLRARWRELRAAAPPDPSWHLHRIYLAFPPEGGESARAEIGREADGLLLRLREGGDFAEIARARSDDVTTRSAGGDAGLVREADLAALFAEPLRAAGVGAVTRVDAPKGVFLLRISEVVDTAVGDFEALRGQLADQLYEEGISREMERWTREERSKAHVELLP
jgi:peptidyl-prolyl cis-trans isomerase SurA